MNACSFTNVVRLYTPALLPKEMVSLPLTTFLILAQFVSTQQNRSRNYCKLKFTGGRAFLTWSSSLTPLIMQQHKTLLLVPGRGKLRGWTGRFMPGKDEWEVTA